MMIDDDEMRSLFSIESAEHLQRLEEGVLRLEKEPGNAGLLEEMFREAHSLKGAARLLGLSDIELIAHRLEDILGAAGKGELLLSPERVDGVCCGLDAIRRLAQEAVTGEPAGTSFSDGIARLRQVQEAGPAPVAAGGEPAPQEERTPAEEGVVDREGRPAGLEDFRIETIRVDTRRLDNLMIQTGELIVTKGRITRRLPELEEITALWDDLGRQVAGLQATGKRQELAKTVERGGEMIRRARKAADDDCARLEFIAAALEDEIRSTRLLPLATLFAIFPRMARDMARQQSKEVQLIVEGGGTTADKRILEEMKDPMVHLIRNAIDHGIEPPDERARNGKPRCGTILVKARRTAAHIIIEVRDDGRGVDLEAIKSAAAKKKLYRKEELDAMTPEQVRSMLFVHGFSTSSFVSDLSGRGVGLDVVRTNVERLKGTVRVESSPGGGCVFEVQLPVTLATARVLIVAVNAVPYALPIECVRTSLVAPRGSLFAIKGRAAILLDGQPVSVARLGDLLELGGEPSATGSGAPAMPCVVIAAGNETVGLLVDELLDEQEIVLMPQSTILKRVRNVSGAVILGTGRVCMVLNPSDLVRSVRGRMAPAAAGTAAEGEERKKVILTAEDSLTTRAQIKRILEGAGYEVVAAVDGMDAFDKLVTRDFDALVTDVCMPNMDGLTLAAKIRKDRKYNELPIVLITSLASDEDRRRGMEAGANAYIVKPAFDQQVLLETLKRLT